MGEAMGYTADTDDTQLAHRVFRGEVPQPCLRGMEMVQGVYGTLAQLYDVAARGAAIRGDLRMAMDLDRCFQICQEIADKAAG